MSQTPSFGRSLAPVDRRMGTTNVCFPPWVRNSRDRSEAAIHERQPHQCGLHFDLCAGSLCCQTQSLERDVRHVFGKVGRTGWSLLLRIHCFSHFESRGAGTCQVGSARLTGGSLVLKIHCLSQLRSRGARTCRVRSSSLPGKSLLFQVHRLAQFWSRGAATCLVREVEGQLLVDTLRAQRRRDSRWAHRS